jgi:hypothetical protein
MDNFNLVGAALTSQIAASLPEDRRTALTLLGAMGPDVMFSILLAQREVVEQEKEQLRKELEAVRSQPPDLAAFVTWLLGNVEGGRSRLDHLRLLLGQDKPAEEKAKAAAELIFLFFSPPPAP